jgi:hypothetical protein
LKSVRIPLSLALGLLLLPPACAPTQAQGVDVAGAAVYAAQIVAQTALLRAATGACWGDCQPGQECDETSGLCVAAPCDAECPAGYECVWADGKQICEMPTGEATSGEQRHERVEHAPRQDDLETSQALCVVAGVIDCADRPHRSEPDAGPSADPTAEPEQEP